MIFDDEKARGISADLFVVGNELRWLYFIIGMDDVIDVEEVCEEIGIGYRVRLVNVEIRDEYILMLEEKDWDNDQNEDWNWNS